MPRSLRRAAVFAAVATLAVAAPLLGRVTPVPFAVLGVAALAVRDGVVFELLARPGDRQAGRLHGFVAYAFAIAGLGVVTVFGLPIPVFVATVVLVGYGNLGAELVRFYAADPLSRVTAFASVGGVAAVAAQYVVATVAGTTAPPFPEAVFLAASGALVGALVRSVFLAREDPLVLFAAATLLWLFTDLAVVVSVERVAVALAVTLLFGALSYALDAASVPGMVTGVLLGLLAVVLGGYGWFVVLFAFFGIGGLSTKYGYERKLERGVAEARGGARGSGNVLGNSLAALVALLLFAAHGRLGVSGMAFQFAFAGSVATALGDTLSSEIGGLYDNPRLITTLERVEAGDDGAVTWQGEVAGLVGTAIIAGLAVIAFDVGAIAATIVVVAGFAGMTADSVFGATVEGGWIGNQSVNFLATAVGAVCGGALAWAVL
ncbi:MAG: TIGR00297 family protein [Halobacteriaceae archaeon]